MAQAMTSVPAAVAMSMPMSCSRALCARHAMVTQVATLNAMNARNVHDSMCTKL